MPSLRDSGVFPTHTQYSARRGGLRAGLSCRSPPRGSDCGLFHRQWQIPVLTPPLKGLQSLNCAYPTLPRWARIVRPTGEVLRNVAPQLMPALAAEGREAFIPVAKATATVEVPLGAAIPGGMVFRLVVGMVPAKNNVTTAAHNGDTVVPPLSKRTGMTHWSSSCRPQLRGVTKLELPFLDCTFHSR